MAQARVHVDDLLQCSICLELFKTPKYLPCLHSFCETCLSSYITSTVSQTSNPRGFNCPVCRSFVTPADSTAEVSTWTESIPTNHFIRSLLDKVAVERNEKKCDSCSERNETKIAKSWCTDCSEAFCGDCELCHKSFKMSKSHNLVNLVDIRTDSVFLTRGTHSITCELHKNEVVKFVCVDHDIAICTICATINHRKCENVSSIDEAAAGVRDSDSTMELMKQLQEDSKEIDELLLERKQSMSTITESSQQIESKIKEVRTMVNEHLDKLEAEAQQDLREKKSSILKKLTMSESKMKSTKESIQNSQRVLRASMEHGSEVQCFTEVRRVHNVAATVKKDIASDRTKVKRTSIGFAKRPDLSYVIGNKKIFGSVRLLENTDFRNGSVKVIREIPITTTHEGKSRVNGIFIMDKIIISSGSSSKLLIYDSDYRLHQETDLPGTPFDLTRLDDRNVLISLIDKRKHIILDVVSMTMRTLDFGEPARGVVYKDGKITFCSKNGRFLKVIDINTKDVKVMTAQGMFDQIWFLCTASDDRFICTDIGKGDISFLNAEGVKLTTYKSRSLHSPRGMDIDNQGNVFVIDMSLAKLHQLNNDGTLVRIIDVDQEIGIKEPWCIRFKTDSNVFMVTPRTASVNAFVAICEFV